MYAPATGSLIVSRAPDLRLMRLLNPFICALLRSPLHALVSRHILLLTYTGRRSGRQYTLPVGHVPDRDALMIVSGLGRGSRLPSKVHVRYGREGPCNVLDECGLQRTTEQ